MSEATPGPRWDRTCERCGFWDDPNDAAPVRCYEQFRPGIVGCTRFQTKEEWERNYRETRAAHQQPETGCRTCDWVAAQEAVRCP